ncbi:MAG: putative Ig domain-containing protein, partial [Planctomycetes bacterium]|nr:putative Ig domain-containing protein [Planctomycetota bacterium]
DGTLFGTPLLDQAGTYHLDLLAEEPNHASAWVSYEFVIDPDLTPRLRVTTTALDDAVEAASYGPVQLVAENSAGNARWDVSGGRLPPGLVLMGDGRVLGTPYPDTEGAYTFIVSVEEADRIGTTASISMRVNATNRLAILTASLPNAREGASYHVQLSGSGGSGILIWSTSSALPDGLTLYASGLLAGDLRNATAGAYSITFELNDEVDAELYGSASRTLTLVVQASQTEEGDTPAATPPQDINGALLTGAAAGCSFAGHDALGAWWLMATAFFALLVRTSLFKRNSSSS